MARCSTGAKKGTDVFLDGGRQGINRLLPNIDALQLADLSHLGGPRFLVTIDTEEEFDWSGPFTRNQHSTNHISAIPRFQGLCDSRGIQPVYLVDYPIASDPIAVALLSQYADAGLAAIGVQLHPWVNPPFTEEISIHNSFACNLPADLEREKLTALYDIIVERFGVRPDMYRAGRYGAGVTTPSILRDLGIRIDSSARACFDYSAQGGPDFSRCPHSPFWLLQDELLELPVTTVYGGALKASGNTLFNQKFSSDTARSMLSRTGMLERIALTPEGIPLAKAIKGIDLALAEGVGILNFSFHSPSLTPGNTPYVRSEADLNVFYAWWHGVFAYLAKRGIEPVTVKEICDFHLPLATDPSHPLSAQKSGL
jgi:hypothetical protein